MEPVGNDKIIIKDLCVHCAIGLSKEERSYPQRILLSLELGLDTREAAASGELSRTVCYSTLKQQVVSLATSKKWSLIEELAGEVCSLVFRGSFRVDSVRVSVKKFSVPDTAWVGVEVERRRVKG